MTTAAKVRGLLWRPNPKGNQTHPGTKQRGDWWVSYMCGLGHRHREKIGPKALARTQYERRKVQVRTEDYCPRRVGNQRPALLSEVLDLVITDYEINRRRSVRRVKQTQGNLLAYFGAGTPGMDVTRDEIAKYIRARLEAGAAPATVNRELACLRRGFRLGKWAGKIGDVPHITMLMEDNVRTGFFEEPEYRALLAEMPENLRPVVTFLYLTGWRLGEVLALKWRQVDFGAGIVRLEPGTTKNDDGRVFPFAVLPELESMVREQHERTRAVEREQGRVIRWVFHRDGEPIKDFRAAWRVACKRAGLVGRIPHDFRRTAVRNLERAGVPRSVAMKLTGHKTESVYRRYAIVSEADLAEGVAKLATLHRGSAPRRVVPLAPIPNVVAPEVAPAHGRTTEATLGARG